MADLDPFIADRTAQRHRVLADEYLRMIDVGVFGSTGVELVEGELYEVAPSQTRHSRILDRVYRALIASYPESQYHLHIDAIVRLAARVARAPDLSVVDNDIGSRKHLQPGDLLLAIEISDTTLDEDLNSKLRQYAAAGIRNYYVVDVEGRQTHRFAQPVKGAYTPLGIVPFDDALPLPGVEATIRIAN